MKWHSTCQSNIVLIMWYDHGFDTGDIPECGKSTSPGVIPKRSFSTSPSKVRDVEQATQSKS